MAVKVLHGDVARDNIAVERFKREFEVSKLCRTITSSTSAIFARPTTRATRWSWSFSRAKSSATCSSARSTFRPSAWCGCSASRHRARRSAPRQFVHRDLKPDNLFLCGTHDGDIVKLLDFGSVKDKSSMAKKLTVVGTTIGSPFYMAPEQAQGLETLDARADVWALAAITYECITGKVPFQGINGPSILLAILTKDPVPPTKAGQGGPIPILPDRRARWKSRSPRIPTSAFARSASWPTLLVGPMGLREITSRGRSRRKPFSGSYPGRAAEDDGGETGSDGHDVGSVRRTGTPVGWHAPHGSRLCGRIAKRSRGGEDFAMGVPKGPPKWLVPAIIGALAVVAGVVGAVLFLK